MASHRWTKHLKEKDQKDDFLKRLSYAKEFMDVLKNILQEDLDALEKEMESKDNYFMPAWSEYQADKIGSRRTLKKIINLIP
jgi:hypothetical protein